jgi:trehalose utilization protein
MADKLRVTVWNEGRHEKKSDKVRETYPEGIHGAICGFLNAADGIEASPALLDDPDHGLSDDVLAATDVLTWWAHIAHGDVRDDIVEKVHRRVLEGMGLIVLHSGHFSKILKRLLGTTCQLKWREIGEREVLWVTRPGHPIVAGIDDHFVIPHTEMYGEHFDIPEPDETVFISGFEGGEVFRSGVTFRRGAGKIFYFRPGHETLPIYRQKEVQQVIINAVRWAAPVAPAMRFECNRHEACWFDPDWGKTIRP